MPLPPGSAAAAALGGVYPNRINSLWSYAQGNPGLFPGSSGAARGAAALKGALGTLLGVDIKYYVMVNFGGFEKVVDTLGGTIVDVQLPVSDYAFPARDDRGAVKLYIPPGIQYMTGAEALQYARARHQTNDFDRAQRQQRVITSVRQQTDLLSLLSPGTLDALSTELRSAIHTDFPASLLPALVSLAQKADLGNLRSYVFTPPVYQTQCAPADCQVHYFIHPEARRHPADRPGCLHRRPGAREIAPEAGQRGRRRMGAGGHEGCGSGAEPRRLPRLPRDRGSRAAGQRRGGREGDVPCDGRHLLQRRRGDDARDRPRPPEDVRRDRPDSVRPGDDGRRRRDHRREHPEVPGSRPMTTPRRPGDPVPPAPSRPPSRPSRNSRPGRPASSASSSGVPSTTGSAGSATGGGDPLRSRPQFAGWGLSAGGLPLGSILASVVLLVVAVVSFGLLGGPASFAGTGGTHGPVGDVPNRTPDPVAVFQPAVSTKPHVRGTILFTKAGNLWSVGGDDVLTQLTTTGADQSPSWGPGGQSVYFVRVGSAPGLVPCSAIAASGCTSSVARYNLQYPDIVSMPAAGGAVAQVKSGLYSWSAGRYSYFYGLWQPVLSPNGQTFALISDAPDPFNYDYQVGLLPAKGGTVRRMGLAEDFGLGQNDPAWSPDGTQIAYTYNHRDGTLGRPRIGVVTVRTGAIRYVTDFGYAQPSFSPDGRYMAAVHTTAKGRDVVIIDVASGSELLRLTSDGQSFAPTWSPAGDQVAFLRANGLTLDLWVDTLSGSGRSFSVAKEEPLTSQSRLDGISKPAWFVPSSDMPAASPPPTAPASTPSSAPPSTGP